MKLLNDATSPFGRKVLVACIERSIPLEERFVDISKPGALDEFNPLRQIPTLVLDDGLAIFDSDVILSYLDSVQGGEPLVPALDRWGVLTRASLGNGLVESVLQRIMEVRRPTGEKSEAFMLKMEERIWRVMERIGAIVNTLKGEPLCVDQIMIACALEYVDFRFSTEWREKFPAIAEWLAEISLRPSMSATAPRRTGPVSVRRPM
jgi:glutathione S-transferase